MAGYLLLEDGSLLLLESGGGLLLEDGGGGGGTEYTKTGAGAAAFSASGDGVATYSESGAGVSVRVNPGADAVILARTGTAIAPFTAAGVAAQNNNYIKTNIGISAFTASGADAVTLSRTGAGTSPFSASAADSTESAEAGTGIAPFVGSGFTTHDYVKTGAAVLVRDGTGDGQWILAQRNKGIFFNSLGWTLGMPHTASGAVEKTVSRTGTAKAPFTAKGRRGDAVAGTATSEFSSSSGPQHGTWNKANISAWYSFSGNHGATFSISSQPFVFGGAEEAIFSETGISVRPLSGVATNAITYVETGVGISARTVNGSSFSPGKAVTIFTGSGARVTTFVESGTGVASFVGRGEVQPAGVAAMVFTGGGMWRSVYANDNFAAREVIDAPTGDFDLDAGPRSYLLSGRTQLATTQTGERREWFGQSFDRTLWWEYRVPFRCLVRLNVSAPGVVPAVGEFHRGTAVNALTFYADARQHFGQVAGRGIDSRFATLTSSWGSFPDGSGLVTGPVSVQVDPSTPLVFNTGRRGASPDSAYTITLERLAVPDGDSPTSAIFLEGTSGVVPFDMAGATAESRWQWAALDTWLLRPNNVRLSADLFYTFTAPEDTTIRFHVDEPTFTLMQLLIFEGTDIDTWTPLPINIEEDYPYVLQNSAGFAEVPVQAGTTYTIALLQMRSVLSFPPFGVISMSYTVRGAGTLTWEYISAPVNDNWADRIDIGSADSGLQAPADTRGSTAEVGEPISIGGNTAARGIWYEYTPTSTGWFSFGLGAGPPTNFIYPSYDVYRGVTPFADFELVSDNRLGMAWLRAGETYSIRLTTFLGYTYDHENLQWELQTVVAAPNDDFANRIVMPSTDSGVVNFDLAGATSEASEPIMYFWNESQQPSLWYEWTPPYTGDYRFHLDTLEFDSGEIGVYTGTTLANLVPIARFSTNDPQIGFRAQAGTTYYFQVGVYGFYEPGGATVPWALMWSPSTVLNNTTFATAAEITTSISTNNFSSTPELEPGAPDLGAIFAEQDEDVWYGRPAWFKYSSPAFADVTLSGSVGDWDAAVFVFKGDTLGALTIAPDPDGNPTWTTIGYGDWALDLRVEADTDYYFLVTGVQYPAEVDFDSEAYNDFFEQDMIPQGEFSINLEVFNLVDDFQTAHNRDDPAWIDYFPSYIYENTENGPLFSSSTGGCHVYSNLGATAEVGEPSAGGGFPATNTVWLFWQAGGAGTFEFEVQPAGSDPMEDPILAVYNWTNSSNISTYVPVATSDNFGGLYPQVTISGVESFDWYLIQVDGRDQGTFELVWRHITGVSPPVNDNFADAIVIAPDDTVVGTTAGATVECGETPVAGWFEGPFGSVWYTFTPTEDGSSFITATVDDHVLGAPTFVDVFQGTTIDNLVNITPADSFSNGDENDVFGFPITYTGGIPVYIRLSTESDGTYDPGDGGVGGTFTLSANAQSTTPPDNDDPGGATDVPDGGGTTPGNSDGAGYLPGEVDPTGGLLEDSSPGGGSTWHKYVAPAPGFVDIYTTRDTIVDYWYRVGVWAGDTPQTGKQVMALAQDPSQGLYRRSPYNGAHPCHFEVREGETYWIQVIRQGDQPWGEYDLHVDEYLERVDWSADDDGFTSTTGSPTFSGGVMTCTGSQAISNVTSVLPQYKTIDLGATVPKWGRETRVYFETRLLAGQALRRELWYGGDYWSFDNAASDDHLNMWMRHLGLLRARDTTGTQQMVVSLYPGANGENPIEVLTGYPGESHTRQVVAATSLGAGNNAHAQGWVSIELVIHAENRQTNGYPAPVSGLDESYPLWSIKLIVDGRPVPGTAYFIGKQLRYLDFGMWRHPSMYSTDSGYSDTRLVEDNEAWTYEMRHMRVTNIVPREPYGPEFAGDVGVFDFDGFTQGQSWITGDNHTANGGSGGVYVYEKLPNVVDAPGKPDQGALFCATPAPVKPSSITYSGSTGSRRFYAYSMMLSESVDALNGLGVAGYNGFLSLYTMNGGELTIHPFGREFCVAHPAPDEWCYVETYIDAEVSWDVECIVYINGQPFGTYSNSYSWSEIGAGANGGGHMPGEAFGPSYENLTVGFGGNMYFTNIVLGMGNPDVIGPLKTVPMDAAKSILPPGIPEEPVDTMTLDGYCLLYDWMYEASNPGPIVSSAGNSVSMNIQGPRFWEEFVELRPTVAWSEESTGGGGAWSPLGYAKIADDHFVEAAAPTATLKLTKFGQSVPVTATVTGIEVKVHRRASGSVSDSTVQLYKTGTLVGSNLAGGGWSGSDEIVTYGGETNMWGTSWSPQEVNALDFGVGIAASGSGTAMVDRVSVKVYYNDPGGPPNINRGGILAPDGLYNFYGDTVVVEYDYSGTATPGVEWPTSGWEPGGFSGGSATHRFGSVYPLWLWQARGDLTPYFILAGTGSGTASNMRIVRNPLIYPRYSWSNDDGATWTWIYPGETDSVDHVTGNLTASAADAIFLDNTGALDRYQASPGGWSSGLDEDRPTGSPAYRYPYHYLAYGNDGTDEDTVYGVNVWAKWRPFNGEPSVSSGWRRGAFRAYVASPNGDVRLAGKFDFDSGAAPFVAAPSASNPLFHRSVLARSPDGDGWSQQKLEDLELRVGFTDRVGSNAFAIFFGPDKGAAVYGLAYELLVPAVADPPPQPCLQLIDLSMARMQLGEGSAVATGDPQGIDLSDAKFVLGSDVPPSGPTGIDLSNVVVAPGNAPDD